MHLSWRLKTTSAAGPCRCIILFFFSSSLLSTWKVLRRGAPKASYRHFQKHCGSLLVELVVVGFWWWMNPSLPKLLLKKKAPIWKGKWMIFYLFLYFYIIFWGSIATQENVSRVAADSDNVFLFLWFSQSGHHPCQDLVKFGYTLNMKVEFLKYFSIFLATYLNQV